jgi:hypothetical protein
MLLVPRPATQYNQLRIGTTQERIEYKLNPIRILSALQLHGQVVDPLSVGFRIEHPSSLEAGGNLLNLRYAG